MWAPQWHCFFSLKNDQHVKHEILDLTSLFTWIVFFIIFRVNMASEHQPDAPSLEFSDDNDSDCYIIDSGSEVEIEYDESESEVVHSESDEMVETEKSRICEETISDVDTSDSESDFGPYVTDRIVWGKPICSRRFLEVRRKVEKAWRVRNQNLARTLNWSNIMRSKGYLLMKSACKKVQRDTQ